MQLGACSPTRSHYHEHEWATHKHVLQPNRKEKKQSHWYTNRMIDYKSMNNEHARRQLGHKKRTYKPTTATATYSNHHFKHDTRTQHYSTHCSIAQQDVRSANRSSLEIPQTEVHGYQRHWRQITMSKLQQYHANPIQDTTTYHCQMKPFTYRPNQLPSTKVTVHVTPSNATLSAVYTTHLKDITHKGNDIIRDILWLQHDPHNKAFHQERLCIKRRQHAGKLNTTFNSTAYMVESITWYSQRPFTVTLQHKNTLKSKGIANRWSIAQHRQNGTDKLSWYIANESLLQYRQQINTTPQRQSITQQDKQKIVPCIASTDSISCDILGDIIETNDRTSNFYCLMTAPMLLKSWSSRATRCLTL